MSVGGSDYYPNNAIFHPVYYKFLITFCVIINLNNLGLHVKVLAILLIAFCGKFGSFYKLIMPKLLSQLNHGESKLNSELKIWKKKSSIMEVVHPGNFTAYELVPAPF